MKKAAVWVKEDKAGNELLTVKLSDGTILNGVFNRFKEEEKHPDFRLVDFSQKDDEGNYVVLGAIWKGETKNGREKLTIRLEDGEYYTAVKQDKKSENAPDYVVIYTEEEGSEG